MADMDVKWLNFKTSDIEDMCELMEKKLYDTAVIVMNRTTCEVSTFGSSLGAIFFARNSTVLNMFRDFCLVYMKEHHCENKENKDLSVKKTVETFTNNIKINDDVTYAKSRTYTNSVSETTERYDDSKYSNFEKLNFEGEFENKSDCFKQETLQNGTVNKDMVDNRNSILCSKNKFKSMQDINKTKDKRYAEVSHGKQPVYECKTCERRFKSKAGLSSHQKYMHEKLQFKSESLFGNSEKNVKQVTYTNKEGIETSGLRCSMYVKNVAEAGTRYSCNICSYSTDRYNAMIEHTQTHVIMKPLTCSLCDKSFKVKKSLWRHTNQHKKFPHMCKTCLKLFEKKEDLEIHQISHNSTHVCDICDRVYDCIGRLNYHKKLSHGPKSVNCKICNSSFTSQSLLRQHMKRHGPKEFFCDKCSCSYFFMHQLTNHLKTHDENSIKYKCTVCPREYVNMSHWKEHMKLHDGSNFVQCDQCGKSYSSRKGLNLHKKSKHLDERTFVCQICEKAFLTKHHLKNHLITHDEKRDYKCRFCNATFKRNEVLKMHENVHTKERKFICDICGEYFLRRSSLRNHRLTHFPEHQRWKCRYCEVRFRTQSSMMTHIKSRHAELDLKHERPMCRKCKQCGKIFAKGLTFRIHMDMHAGVKRHKCQLCGNAFTDPANLRMHMKIHDGSSRNKSHACDQCHLHFRSAKLLEAHMDTHKKTNFYEGQHFYQPEQHECLDLSSVQNKAGQGESLTTNSSNYEVDERFKKAHAAATLPALGDFDSGLMPLHASHGLVSVIGQQHMANSYFSDSKATILTQIGSTTYINSENDSPKMNSGAHNRL